MYALGTVENKPVWVGAKHHPCGHVPTDAHSKGAIRALLFRSFVGAMTASTFCSTCSRTVYLASDDPAECPVCSMPLVGSTEELIEEA